MLYLDSAHDSASVHSAAVLGSGAMAPPAVGLESTMASGSTRSIKAREHVFNAGDARTHVFRIEAGCVCLYKIMPDGRRQVIDFAYPGDYIGLGCDTEHSLNAQALEPARLRCLPAATLTRLAGRDPMLGLKMYEALSLELAAAQDHLFTIGQRSAAERVACFLLALSRRNRRRDKDPGLVVLPMTRSDIADFLGLTIETISRMLTKLRQAKIIDLEQCTLVRILDGMALERLAQGEAQL